MENPFSISFFFAPIVLRQGAGRHQPCPELFRGISKTLPLRRIALLADPSIADHLLMPKVVYESVLVYSRPEEKRTIPLSQQMPSTLVLRNRDS